PLPCLAHSPSTHLSHSLPTRRSSDLHPGVVDDLDHDGGRPDHHLEHDARPDDHHHPCRHLHHHLARPREHDHVDQRAGRVDHHQDRKSTRLNSSHGSISYAVFCLKKK